LTKGQRGYNGRKLIFSTCAVGTTGHPHEKRKGRRKEGRKRKRSGEERNGKEASIYLQWVQPAD
jgi:hypothetical protein